MANLNTPDDSKLAVDHIHIQQPTLLVTCALDPIGAPAMQEAGTRPYVRNLTIKELGCGHWPQAEKIDELNQTLEAFLN